MSNSKGSVKVDNLITVHVLKYDGKEIPVYFNKELIMDRLVEATTIIDLFKHYLSENNIECTDINKKTFMASEAVSSAFIEGYETYIPAEFIVKGLIPSTKDERAIVSGYNASLLLNSLDTGVDVNSLLRVWRKLIKYKPFLRKNFRHCGVKVGNKFKTVHVAPNKKYVKDMLNSMLDTLNSVSFEWDTYNMLQGILFHYIFTYIHPFVDGNGRCSRLFENYYLMLSTGIPYFCQISNIILRNKSKYYKSFNSGKCYIDGELRNIDITDFINVNLYFISVGYIKLFKDLGYNFDMCDVEEYEAKSELYDKLGVFDRAALKCYIDNVDLYCKLLLNGVFEVTYYDKGLRYKVKNYDLYSKNIDKKWSEGDSLE